MAPEPVAAARSCTGWASTTRPPNSIRVFNRTTGRVERVNFRRYVGVVMASGEWPARMPPAVLQAGAVAVKQFAWYHSLQGRHRPSFVTASGQCYDVTSSTRDQMYRPAIANVSPKHWQAIDSTWGLSVRKNGRFTLTQYNSGSARNCGADANGRIMKQRSARNCANRGYSARQILRTYYGPNVSLSGGSGGTDAPRARSADSQTAEARGQRRAASRQVMTRPVAPQPEVEVVPWWQSALGEEPMADAPVRAGAGQAMAEDAAADSAQAEIRLTTVGGATDQFPPLVVRSPPDDSGAILARTTVSFVGRSLRLAAVPGPAGDVVSVYVDDEPVAMVDTSWSATHEEVVIFEREWDGEELHTIELLLSGASEQLRLEVEANQIHY
ncbi:MAG TPA: SpoIID/LytB domain-containing protein [Candidatus Limnocylindria bacterium]|nr:SpoIID/LytB domain-containing protein [Candidatus Limnocylindria bacterium]